MTGLAVSPGGAILSCSLDSTVRVWRDGACTQVLEGHEGPVQCLAVMPNGRLLSGSNDTTVKVWELDVGRCVLTIQAHGDTVRRGPWPAGGVACCGAGRWRCLWTVALQCRSLYQTGKGHPCAFHHLPSASYADLTAVGYPTGAWHGAGARHRSRHSLARPDGKGA